MKLLFTFLLLSSVCLGQSKKDQIITLNTSIDSLNTVLSTTRDNASKDIGALNDKIGEISTKVTALRSDLTNLQASNNKLTKENEKFKTDLGELSKKNLQLDAKLKAVELENEVGRFTYRLYEDGEGLHGQESCEIYLKIGVELHHVESTVGHPSFIEKYNWGDIPTDAIEALRISFAGDRTDLYTRKTQFNNLNYIVIMKCFAVEGGDGNCNYEELKRFPY